MDWSRAKNILILIFILLNVFLSAIIISELRGSSVTKETISDTRLALKDRGVDVNCSIPDFDGSIGNLVYKKTGFDWERLAVNIFGDDINNDDLLDKRIMERDGKKLTLLDEYTFLYENSDPGEVLVGLKNQDRIMGFIEKLFKGTEVPVLDYRIDIVEVDKSDITAYVFRQKYRDFWVIENHITVSLSDNDLTVMCRYQEIDGIKNNNKIIPVYQVLLKNHDTIKDITINKIDLGFKTCKMDDGSKGVDGIPVWCIEIQGKDNMYKRFFSAYDGDEIE